MAGFRIKYDIDRIWVRIQPLRKTRIRIQYFYQIGSGSSVFKIFTKQLLEIIMHTFVPRIRIWVLNPVPDQMGTCKVEAFFDLNRNLRVLSALPA